MSKGMNLEELLKIPRFYNLTNNRKRDTIGWISNITGAQEIYIFSNKDRDVSQLTKGNLPKSSFPYFFWMKDDKSIVFNKDLEGNEKFNIHQIIIESGEEIKLTDTEEFTDYPAASNVDGSELCFGSDRAKSVRNIYVLDLEASEIRQLTFHTKYPCWTIRWSPDGSIYYSTNETGNPDNMDVWKIVEEGTEPELFLQISETSSEFMVDTSKDGKLLAIQTNVDDMWKTGIMNKEGKRINWLSDSEFDVTPVQFSIDGSRLLCLKNKDAKIYPIIYDLEESTCEELVLDGVVREVIFFDDDSKLVYSYTNSTTPRQLMIYDFKTKTHEVFLKASKEFPSDYFYKTEYISYKSFDGEDIHSILYKPIIEPGKKYPAIIVIHGGPWGQVTQSFNAEDQIYTDNGFVILVPNFRGSTGYGKEFRDKNLKDWGGGDAKDIIYGKKYLENLDYVDPNRIGIMGGSYGGYMTYILMTKYSDANWNAGAASVGITDLKELVEVSTPDYAKTFERFMGTYEENVDLYKDRSPINHVEKIKNPILMLHRTNDKRCPVGQIRKFRDKLLELNKKEGIDFEYHEFGGQGHTIADTDHYIEDVKVTIDFFKRMM